MNTSLVAQNTDFVEQAKQLSAGCDFFKELDELYAPHAEAAAEAFRREWMERYENGEIELEEDYELDSEGNFGDELKAGDSEGWNMTDPSSIAKYQRLCQDKAFSRVFPLCAMIPITDIHREFIVICHARRLDTEEALIEMVNYFEEFAFLRPQIKFPERPVNGVLVEVPKLEELLLPLFRVWKRAFSYLRPTHTRWPNQKYGELWRDVKAAYSQARILEVSGTTESVIAGLAEAVQKAQDLVASSPRDQLDVRAKTLISLSTALHKILLDEKRS